MMRAAVLRDRQFVVEELSRPVPGPGEVLVKVLACGICGSDLHFVRHAHDMVEQARKLGAPTEELERGLRTGLVLGHEFVGEIVEMGPDTARGFLPGDRVCSVPFVLRGAAPVLIGSNPETSGAYAEYMLLTEALLVKVNSGVPDAAAALTEPLGIAIHAVNKANLQATDVAVVLGCGPIGLAITAVLKSRGVRHIVATDLSPRRLELAMTMGATEVVDGRDQPGAVAKAAGHADGAGVVIFENTGAPGMLAKLVLEAPAKSRLVLSGIAPGEESFHQMVAIIKELQFSFIIYYTPEEFASALEMLAANVFDWHALVTGVVGLDGVNEAFKALEDPEVHAKILIDPQQRSGLRTLR